MLQWPKTIGDPAYDSMVLGAVSSGSFEHAFVPLTIEIPGHRAVFQVSQDALKIDGVRIDASAILQQHIADMIGAHLVTPRLLDQMWKQRAVTVLPCIQPITMTTKGMIDHSACIDKQLAGVGPVPGIIQTVGKTWVLSNRLSPTVAMNMGWYLEKQMPGVPFDPAPTLPDAHMIQSPGTRHGPLHADYSQICLFVARDCVLDGQKTTFADIARTPALAALVSHEGVLKILRQPGANELVTPPSMVTKSAGAATVALTAVGAAAGAAIAGPPGALVGAAIGWAADAVRRTLA